MQYTYWEQADRFLDVVGYIQDIRARLSPETQTDTDELGSISADDIDQGKPGHVHEADSELYWNLCGGLYAYLYSELAKRGGSKLRANPSLWATPRSSPAFRWWTGIPASPTPASGCSSCCTTTSVRGIKWWRRVWTVPMFTRRPL